jgi:hypothetical protein
MRAILPILGFCLIGLAAGEAGAESPPEAKPRTYALLAAMGGQFTFVYQVQHVGSHLSPYRRNAVDAPENVINRLVLQSLDDAVREIDPSGKRVYLALPAPQVDKVLPAQREEVAIGLVAAELEKMPQRLEWERIYVVTPAYSALKRDGMAEKLQGLGVYTQPLRSNREDFFGDASLDMHSGETVTTPDKLETKSSVYVAPYSYIEVWVLDPKTLAIIEKRATYDSQKLYDPMGSLDMSQNVDKKVLAQRIVSLIDRSVYKAVTGNERRGTVELRDGKVVTPAKAR